MAIQPSRQGRGVFQQESRAMSIAPTPVRLPVSGKWPGYDTDPSSKNQSIPKAYQQGISKSDPESIGIYKRPAMRKYVQEATDINIWKSIQNNTFDRNKDIKSFIEGLNLIEGSTCISLDAKWGDGKTFFVRQIEEVLKYARLKQWKDEENPVDQLPSYEYLRNNQMANSINQSKSYLPIYYNA